MAQIRLSNTLWRWLRLAPAVYLMFGAKGTLAQATIPVVHLSTPNPDPNFRWDHEGMRLISSADPISLQIDLDGDGDTDYTVVAGGRSSRGFTICGSGQNCVLGFPVLDSNYAAALSPGDAIGPTPLSPYKWNPPIQSAQASLGSTFAFSIDFYTTGAFAWRDSAFAGLRFTTGNATRYGWIRVGAPLPFLNGGWIYEYAFETRPGVSIRAGAKPVMVAVAAPAVVRPGYLRLNWLSEIGKAYQVQSKPSLDAFAWTNLNFALPATTTNTLLDLPMTGATQFFRVVEAD